MPKAVAIQTLFIIIFIGLTVFFTMLALGGWLGIQVPELNSLWCAGSKLTYCDAICYKEGSSPSWPESCGETPSCDCDLGG